MKVSPTIEKEKELSTYLEEWTDARYPNWSDFQHEVFLDRKTGIYRLKSGDRLMQMLINIKENVLNHLCVENGTHIIPSKFSSVPQLMQFLDGFNRLLKSDYHLIEQNIEGENTNWIILELNRICHDIDQMVTRCQEIYFSDDSIPVTYSRIKRALNQNDVNSFVDLLKSLITNVPYNIHKEKLDEGYFHTIIHVICSVLGMSPISELETMDGRIDMMIEYPSRLFIIEFKYSKDGEDRSQEALDQIIDNRYAEGYYIKGKIIEGIGISFSQEKRNIDGYKQKRLYIPNL